MSPSYAGIAQLVERNLAKVEVGSSSLLSRSRSPGRHLSSLFLSRYGWVAEWSCSGLQSRVRRFDSDPSLHNYKFPECARVAELVDARDLKSLDRKVMPVRFRPRAPICVRSGGDGRGARCCSLAGRLQFSVLEEQRSLTKTSLTGRLYGRYAAAIFGCYICTVIQ